MKLIAGLAACAGFAALVTAEVASNTVSGTSGFEFVAKFCYDSHKAIKGVAPSIGTVQIAMTMPKDDNGKITYKGSREVDVLLYDDEAKHWNKIYGTSYNDLANCDDSEPKCAKKQCEARRLAANNCKNKDNCPMGAPGGFYHFNLDDKTVCTNGHCSTPQISITGTHQPRFWYVVLSSPDCTSMEGLHVTGTFLQAKAFHGSWSIQFGVNEEGLNTLYLVFFIAYVVMVGVHLWGVKTHWSTTQYVHPVLKIFTLVLLLTFVATMMNMLHYMSYQGDGAGMPVLARIGEVVSILAQGLFMMLLMLLARGWTISTEELTGKKLVLGVSAAFNIFNLLMLIFKYGIEDPAATSPGAFYDFMQYLLMAAWLVFAGFFLVSTFRSWKAEDNEAKASLYFKMLIMYGPWFLGLPIVNLLGIWVSPLYATKIVVIFSVLVNCIANSIMVFLMWPSRAADYFAIAAPSTATMEHYNQL